MKFNVVEPIREFIIAPPRWFVITINLVFAAVIIYYGLISGSDVINRTHTTRFYSTIDVAFKKSKSAIILLDEQGRIKLYRGDPTIFGYELEEYNDKQIDSIVPPSPIFFDVAFSDFIKGRLDSKTLQTRSAVTEGTRKGERLDYRDVNAILVDFTVTHAPEEFSTDWASVVYVRFLEKRTRELQTARRAALKAKEEQAQKLEDAQILSERLVTGTTKKTDSK